MSVFGGRPGGLQGWRGAAPQRSSLLGAPLAAVFPEVRRTGDWTAAGRSELPAQVVRDIDARVITAEKAIPMAYVFANVSRLATWMDADSVALLLRRNADAWPEGLGAAMKMACFGGVPDVVARVLRHGARLEGDDARTQLVSASRDTRTDVVLLLLQAGVDVHVGHDEALRQAARNGNDQVVAILLAHGANVHVRNDEAVRYAASRQHTTVMELLFAHGANVHVDQDVMLRHAALNGHMSVVQVLLKHGADVHAVDDAALRWTCDSPVERAHVVKLLLDHGANVHAGNGEALRHATYYGHTAVMELLLRAGA